ncbi:MAG: hypothetical protein Kilf2KO_26800 [Rhodospirillales bacterium]
MTSPPDDPLFAAQWHLANPAAGEFDLNVLKAWEDYSGKGVDAFVIDDGFDYDHVDLAPNYDRSRHLDIEEDDGDPFGTASDAHGTATMGILGAARNATGTVGVAYDATLVGYQAMGLVGNAAEALAAAPAAGADLVNMSIGVRAAYFDFQPINDAVALATDAGRGGLGTILIKSAGNARDDAVKLDANFSSWNGNERVISVAAIDRDGQVSSYSSEGANLWVSAFGSPIPGQVVTTDRSGSAGYDPGDYTSAFNGTSAAAPMVSGVVALMLEANPNLGWRDVQAILANTARRYDESGKQVGEDAAWSVNGAAFLNSGGYHFSEDYGFGLVDAHAAVRLAEYWPGIADSSNRRSETADGLDATVAIPDPAPDRNVVAIDFAGPGGIAEIEYVFLEIAMTHTWVGDLTITLTSPAGTETTLLDRSGNSVDHPASWTYSANAFRGESSDGTWTLKISDWVAPDPGVITDIKLTASAALDSSDDVYVFTEEFSLVQGTANHDGTIADGDGGRDMINAAALLSDSSLDLGAGSGLLDGRTVSLSGIEDAVGGDGADSLVGSSAANLLIGGRGEDTLRGRQGDDSLEGAEASDSLFGDSGGDRLFGGAQGDSLQGGSGSDLGLYGGDGRDFVNAGWQADSFLYGGSGSDRLLGNQGDDAYLFGGRAADSLFGGPGDDSLLRGGEGRDALYGGSGRDSGLYGGSGVDSLFGGSGQDALLLGNLGDDSLFGGAAADRLYGGLGRDLLEGEAGNDRLVGGSGSDSLFGGQGRDRLNGSSGTDWAAGGLGDDTLTVDTTTDLLRELKGGGVDLVQAEVDYTLPDGGSEDFVENLRLRQEAGDIDGTGNGLDNSLEGNSGDNRLQGAAGDDIIAGGLGDDSLLGGSGADLLLLGQGDRAFGGSGADSFRFDGQSQGTSGGDGPRLQDFEGSLLGGGADKLVFATGLESGSFAYLGAAAFSGGGDSQARFAGSAQLQVDRDGDGAADIAVSIVGLTAADQLTASDFLWL